LAGAGQVDVSDIIGGELESAVARTAGCGQDDVSVLNGGRFAAGRGAVASRAAVSNLMGAAGDVLLPASRREVVYGELECN